jgi:hypothetical protein
MPLMADEGRGNVTRALTLLSSPRFVRRPASAERVVGQQFYRCPTFACSMREGRQQNHPSPCRIGWFVCDLTGYALCCPTLASRCRA